jgi:hypothetical protein
MSLIPFCWEPYRRRPCICDMGQIFRARASAEAAAADMRDSTLIIRSLVNFRLI